MVEDSSKSVSEKRDQDADQKDWYTLIKDYAGVGEANQTLHELFSGGLAALRSAPLRMMFQDAEGVVTTTWKRQWRKAISGDSEKRVRDHMSSPEVQRRVKLYDTASFTFGVVMVFFAEYLFLVRPTAVPLFYLFTFSILTMLRYFTYHAVKYHYFLLDFCYFLNGSTALQSLVCNGISDEGTCSTWLKANFMLSHGPISMAILAWQNSLVFHSLDKMTSFFIHIMPTLLNYIIRWNILPGSVQDDVSLSLSLWSAVLVPCAGYLLWQACYLYIQNTVIDKDPELVTSYRYLIQCPKNPMYNIVRDICVAIGVFAKDETYQPETFKSKFVFLFGQFIYIVVCLIPIPLVFYFKSVNTLYLLFLMVAATWRGGSYYVFQFTKTYNKKFSTSNGLTKDE